MSKSFIVKVSGVLIGLACFSSAGAVEVKITPTLTFVETVHNGERVRIMRNQDQQNHLTGDFTKTSRKCPPFCVQPMKVADGVETVGEVELLDFIKKNLPDGSGVLVDARTPSWYHKGTIPGSVNIPFTSFRQDADPLVVAAALTKLGAIKRKDGDASSILQSALAFFSNDEVANVSWDFSQAKDVVMWCNGIWCGQSPRAIKGLLALGYPAEKIKYYRGGMQAWVSLGLNIVEGK